jgi:4-aminobutyrate aminotransferase-like enzyme
MLPEILTSIPGPRSREAAETLRRFESRNVTYLDSEFPVFWERAEGTNVWDADGNRFLDWTSAFGVAGLGHTNPVVRDALVQQSGSLFHAMGDVHPALLKPQLCARLSALTFQRWGLGEGKVILGNSGFEAVEAALKTALLRTGKPGVIAFEGGYHGLGYGALEVVGMPYFRDPFRAQLAQFGAVLPFPSGEESLNALEGAIEAALKEKEIGAILVEPIQGRGGERIPPAGFLGTLRAVCDRHGLVLIFDEIYTGLNRTGALFACDHVGVLPDLICLGKALTSGFPLSACVGKAEIMDTWPLSGGEALHTSTFLGNPLGCAMALASLGLHEQPETAAGVKERGERLRQALEGIQSPHVVEVRGVGLLFGMELNLDGGVVNSLVKRGLRDGLILLQSGPAGNVLAFTPPFAISDEEIRFTAERIQDYLGVLAGSVS